MKVRVPHVLILVLALVAGGPARAATGDAVAVATELLDRLDRGEYEAATAPFSPGMRAAVGADKLRAIWQALPAQFGAPRGRGSARSVPQEAVTVVTIPLEYANGTLDAQVAVDAEGRVAGFFVRPAAPPPPAPPAADAGYTERDVRIGDAERALPGTLARPSTDAAGLPAVVLVHGSGPNDRNETIGPNRPFLDLARGLAERGIATLRYDKRTHARPQDFAAGDFDMDDETTRDAVAAVALLRATPGIDPSRVFVLGHSQGGMLAPRVAAHSGHVAGLILLAAPARPLLDLLPEQQRYLALLDGTVSADEQAALDLVARQIAAVRGDGPVTAKDSPLGMPPGYWRAFDRIDPVADAKATTVPLLLLQGGRDIQVTATDWQRWQQAFGSSPRATLRHYPALNHLGIAGEGPGSLAEYQRPGHVDARLIADIAEWVTVRSAPGARTAVAGANPGR